MAKLVARLLATAAVLISTFSYNIRVFVHVWLASSHLKIILYKAVSKFARPLFKYEKQSTFHARFLSTR